MRLGLWSLLFCVCCLAAFGQQGETPQPREEDLTQKRFSEAHESLLKSPKRSDAGSLTERVVGSRPAAELSSSVERHNFIDERIFGKMERDGIPHAPLSSDAEFLRRVTLDLTGRIPKPAEVHRFTANPDPSKRDRLIDDLLSRTEYEEKWAYFFMDLFRANGKMGRGRELFHYWLKENLRSDRPYNEIAHDIISASAKSNHVVAAANVIAREHVQGKAQPDDGADLGMVHQLDTHDELSILYAKAFLGVNLSCISCHDGKGHLEEVNVWLSGKTRREFFRNSAFLGRSRYLMYWEDGKPQSGEFLIDDHNPGYDTKGASMLRIQRFGGPSEPAFILTGAAPEDDVEPRDALASMLTSHPQFARASVNLFWSRLMGVGIVEPFDEFDLARQDPDSVPEGWQLQPTHPALLDALTKDFRESGYSLKHLMATICQSSTYQLSARFPDQWEERYTQYFARKFVRMLSAEELHDAIAAATNRPGNFKFGGGTVGMAMKLSQPSGGKDLKYLLRTFGQSTRRNPPKPLNGSVLQPLILMQSPVVRDRVLADKDSRVQQLLDTYPDNAEVVDQLFVATLSRRPSPPEREVALAALSDNRIQGAQDLQWALINTVDFLFNY